VVIVPVKEDTQEAQQLP
jgi:hypothetical protein